MGVVSEFAQTADLSGQVAMVTGASQGLGQACARHLAACGAVHGPGGVDQVKAPLEFICVYGPADALQVGSRSRFRTIRREKSGQFF